ncbi:transport-associated protein [Sulfuricella sp. T08]|uniref:BON domain-containing protein n=1 Tax=Sulfuricella sp. T08 TaxID=1632857 RepID=UPI000617996C|nr:BON domain-containing protein [Sulfuricella sp. T08]GAO36442.1 transport-associated protein [Sulfuricella sp. T08]
MKTKLVTACLVIGTLLAPIAAYSADSDKDRSHPMTYVKDSVITAKIKAKLAADHPGSMKHIQVDTDKDGVVWLTGTANTQEEINQAIATARNTEGVKSVWSDLKIKMDK